MSAKESDKESSYNLLLPAPEAAGVSTYDSAEVVSPNDSTGESGQRAELPQVSPPPLPVTNDPVSKDGMLAASQIGAAASTTTPQMAEDADLIEKEWVEKAKAIVQHFREDPHKQSKEISQFKADYIKKRYNKELPVGE